MVSDFIKFIQDRHGSKIPEVDYDAMHKFFSALSKKSIEKLWGKFKTDYDSNYRTGRGAPTVARIRKFAVDFNIPLHMTSDGLPALRCDTCGLIYAHVVERLEGCAFCPRCGEMGGSVILNCGEERIVFAQDHCWKCDKYINADINPIGPGCKYHGTGKIIEDCDYCQCKDCCKEYGIYPERKTQEQRQEEIQEKKTTWQERRLKNLEISEKFSYKGESTIKEIADKKKI